MFVIPKRRHQEIVDELNSKIRMQRIDLNNITVAKDKYKSIYKECVEEKEVIDREKEMLKKSNVVKQDMICRLEYRLEETVKLVDEEVETNKKLVKIINEYEDKLIYIDDKEIGRLEKIASRSKKQKVKNKCENRILNIKEAQMMKD